MFVASGVGGGDDPLFANAFFAGALAIAVSGLATAFVADRAGDALPAGERSLVPLVFGWGVVWWLAAGGVELVRQLSDAAETHAVLAWVTAGVALALVLRRLLPWPRLAGAGIALLPTMAVAALGDFDLARTTLHDLWLGVWPCAWLVHWRALRAADAPRRPRHCGQRPEVRCRRLPGHGARAVGPRADDAARVGGERVDRPLHRALHGVDTVRGGAAGDRVPVARGPVARRARAGRPFRTAARTR